MRSGLDRALVGERGILFGLAGNGDRCSGARGCRAYARALPQRRNTPHGPVGGRTPDRRSRPRRTPVRRQVEARIRAGESRCSKTRQAESFVVSVCLVKKVGYELYRPRREAEQPFDELPNAHLKPFVGRFSREGGTLTCLHATVRWRGVWRKFRKKCWTGPPNGFMPAASVT